jgi:hypothetical protein
VGRRSGSGRGRLSRGRLGWTRAGLGSGMAGTWKDTVLCPWPLLGVVGCVLDYELADATVHWRVEALGRGW